MDHLAAVEQQLVSERMRRKLNEVNVAAEARVAPVQDHINFTLQQAYFKCAYECFDRSRKQEEISNCVEHCSVPVANTQHHFENKMAKFQEDLVTGVRNLVNVLRIKMERLNRSLMVCQDKFESSKFQQIKTEAINELESCVNQPIKDNIKTLPHLVGRLKASFNMPNEY